MMFITAQNSDIPKQQNYVLDPGEEPPENVYNYKYLGICIHDNLEWHYQHI